MIYLPQSVSTPLVATLAASGITYLAYTKIKEYMRIPTSSEVFREDLMIVNKDYKTDSFTEKNDDQIVHHITVNIERSLGALGNGQEQGTISIEKKDWKINSQKIVEYFNNKYSNIDMMLGKGKDNYNFIWKCTVSK